MMKPHTIRILGWTLTLTWILTLPIASTAAPKDAKTSPWLIPPHILEFTGPLPQLFGTNKAFGARVSIIDVDAPKNTKPSNGLLLFRDGNTIFEPDSAPIKAARSSRKNQEGDFGLLIVALADKGLAYVVSEGVSGYTEVPLTKGTTGKFAIQSSELGRERVQGFDCVKKLVAVVPEQGEGQVFMVWEASRLRGFPVKVERKKGGPTLVFIFSEIRFERPDDSLFSSPQGYQHYATLNDMTDEMTRRVWNVVRRPDQSIAFPPSTIRNPAGGAPRAPGY